MPGATYFPFRSTVVAFVSGTHCPKDAIFPSCIWMSRGKIPLYGMMQWPPFKISDSPLGGYSLENASLKAAGTFSSSIGRDNPSLAHSGINVSSVFSTKSGMKGFLLRLIFLKLGAKLNAIKKGILRVS